MRILQSRILFHEKNRRNIPMQKIAFHLNSLQQGGAERVVSNLANRFAKEGYEVVIATEWYGTDEFALDQKVRRVGLTKEDENRSRISKMLRRIWYLRRFMKKEKPDVVVAFTRGVLYRALAAGIGTGIPVVISVRTDPVGHYDKKADKLRIPLLFPDRGRKSLFCTVFTGKFQNYFKSAESEIRWCSGAGCTDKGYCSVWPSGRL